jgi:E3 ubiquitin-protein ligase HUWE1
MNTIVRLLIKKNVVTDLARIPHSLDLSSPQLAGTVNAALKPLEVISRIVNQPVPANPARPKMKSESTNNDSVNNTNTGKYRKFVTKYVNLNGPISCQLTRLLIYAD